MAVIQHIGSPHFAATIPGHRFRAAQLRLLVITQILASPLSGSKSTGNRMTTKAQENVWDYPRPPALEKTPKRLRVLINDTEIASTTGGYRVLETSHPPTYYIPRTDVAQDLLEKDSGRNSFCEWKGHATYWNVKGGPQRKIWSYEQPTGKFGPIAGYLSFYAHPPFRCFVDDEEAEQQPGDFYGGWKTSDVSGKMKGAPGTMHW